MHIRLTLLLLSFAVVARAGEPPPAPPPASAALLEAGRRIYEDGVLPSGQPLRGVRLGGSAVEGPDAACILCHQRSGMGLTEGAVPVPPVTGPALFGKLELATYGRTPRRAPGMAFKDYHFKTRPPYTDASLASTMRSGVSPTGHAFEYMMPKYELADPEMAALLAYLRALSSQPSPGASAREMHFATVLVPGIEPARRQAFLDVLQGCFDEKLAAGGEPAAGEAPAQQWRLHVWQLEGAPDTWQAQLQARYEKQPVFATVSGLGGDEWAPVERFCEANRLPCLFPNAEVPGSAAGGRYSFYFYRGVLLEADVIASHLLEKRETLGQRRVIQVSRRDGAGARASAALAATLAGTPLVVENRLFEGVLAAGGAEFREGLESSVVLVLWLREADLARLGKAVSLPPKAGMVLVSGVLGGQENLPLPAAWRQKLLMTYPYDPPARWNRRMDFNLRTWLAQHGIARNDERMQGNTLAACNLLTEGVLRLRGQLLRDYLVEWTENYPTQMGNAPAPQAFPRFSLGPGQRFSSKGAHIVRFAGANASRLVPEAEWIVP
jgi:hypothetical protein